MDEVTEKRTQTTAQPAQAPVRDGLTDPLGTDPLHAQSRTENPLAGAFGSARSIPDAPAPALEAAEPAAARGTSKRALLSLAARLREGVTTYDESQSAALIAEVDALSTEDLGEFKYAVQKRGGTLDNLLHKAMNNWKGEAKRHTRDLRKRARNA